MTVVEYYQDGLGYAVASPRRVSLLRKLVNVVGCVVCLPLYWLVTVHCRWPVTLDLFITVALTELNRLVNEGRRMALREKESMPSPCLEKAELGGGLKQHVVTYERSGTPDPSVDVMAAVVGWREDPDLFRRALESYQGTRCCKFLLVGIDGDEEADQDMVNVFNEVYPHGSRTIHVPEPLGEVAMQVKAKEKHLRSQDGARVDEAELDAVALRHCIQLARTLLDQAGVSFSGPDAVRQICLSQRHMHKKGVMFTTYVFALVVADALGIEYLWSSDSDTIVLDGSLAKTTDAMASDPSIGGASSGLVVHNGDESVVTKLAETVYWGELYLTRSTPAATATSDCQSGPSTLFRLAAMPPILVPWYMQTIFGKRMIINEDRHLTTNLLARGWGVVFASDVLAATDTPTTLTRWLRQQVRWGRATHIESLLQPKVYVMSHPLLFYGMARRELGPLIAFLAIVYYFLTSGQLIAISVPDLLLRVAISLAYNLVRNPHRLQWKSVRWVVPGIFFYHVPLPAVHVWSMLTLTADGWGTAMRASGEMAKKDSVSKAWFETGFFVVWVGIVAGVVAKALTRTFFLGLGDGAASVVFLGSICVASYLGWKVTIANDS